MNFTMTKSGTRKRLKTHFILNITDHRSDLSSRGRDFLFVASSGGEQNVYVQLGLLIGSTAWKCHLAP